MGIFRLWADGIVASSCVYVGAIRGEMGVVTFFFQFPFVFYSMMQSFNKK
jgi:hypothetical protein